MNSVSGRGTTPSPGRRFGTYIAACCVLFTLNCLIFAVRKSPVVDEVGHLGAGLMHWQTGDRLAYCVNPPLPRLVGTLPLYLSGIRVDPKEMTGDLAKRDEFKLGRSAIRDHGREVSFPLTLGRLLCTLMMWPGIMVTMWWTRSLGNEASGVIAGLLYALSPQLVSHSSVLTPDGWAASFGIIWSYLLLQWIRRAPAVPSWVVGVATGVLWCTKFTWLPISTILLILGLAVRLRPDWSDPNVGLRRSLFKAQIDVATLSAFLLIVVWSVYGWAGIGTRIGDIPLRSVGLRPMVQSDQHDGSTHNMPSPANRFSGGIFGQLLSPLPPNMIRGIDYQRTDLEDPPNPHSYLMGQWKQGGWVYYYVVAFLVKTPVTTIVLCLIGLIALVRQCFIVESDNLVALPLSALCLCLPIVLTFSLVSANTGFNRHLRYLLPIYPHLCVLGGIGASRIAGFLNRPTGNFRSMASRAMPILSLMLAFEFYAATPHWMSYYNFVVGGSERGSAWLLGSNTDWGQNLFEVERWMREHPDRVPVYLGLEQEYSPTWFGLTYRDPRVVYGTKPNDEAVLFNRVNEGWYLVSRNVSLRDPSRGTWPWIQRVRSQIPVETIANTVDVFHVKKTTEIDR